MISEKFHVTFWIIFFSSLPEVTYNLQFVFQSQPRDIW